MEIKPRVKLLFPPTNPIETIYCAASQCYSSEFICDIIGTDKSPTIEEMITLILKVIKSGHTSILEHVKYTFAIDGVSRANTHQIVRHRIASYSQQSQRYCDMSKDESFEYIIPESIRNNKKTLSLYINLMKVIDTTYGNLKEILSKDLKTSEQVNQDARYVLPNACSSKIVTTMNIRALFNFFELRCCNRAQWEIRYIANEMLKLCKENCPSIFELTGPKCKQLGYCPEGKFTCGKFIEIMKDKIVRLKGSTVDI